MKKTYIYIICGVLLIVALILGKYFNYKSKKAEIDKFNLEFEQFTKKEIYGTQLATIINKAIDNNEANDVEKEYVKNDKKEYYYYIANEINSIKIDIKIIDNEVTYKMESLYQGNISKFVQHYNYILFKCTEVEYNKQGKISYMLFEQVSK